MTHTQHKTMVYQAKAELQSERRDRQRRDIVNHGISVQESGNTMAALEYLKSHNIDPRVIERVLLEPGRRRPFTSS